MMRKKSGGRDGSGEPQFKTAADEIAYFREKSALAEKTISEKDKIIDRQAKTIRQKDKTIERQAKTIAKKTETIASVRKKNKELESTIRDLKAAMGRYEKSMKIHTREYARIQNALDVALKRLCLVDSAHTPTSKQMVPKKGREGEGDKEGDKKGREGKAGKPAKRPGPPAGHPGTTDERPVTHQARAKLHACKECGCKWIKIREMFVESVTDIPKVVFQKIKLNNVIGNCMACNHKIEGVFELDDVREIEPSGGTGCMSGAAPSGGGPAAGPSGDTDGGAPVRPGGEREVDAGNGLVQIVRDEAVPAESRETASTGTDEDTDSKAPVRPCSENEDGTSHGGLVRAKRADDEDATVGDVVEAADVDGEEMEIPEKGTLGFNMLYMEASISGSTRRPREAGGTLTVYGPRVIR